MFYIMNHLYAPNIHSRMFFFLEIMFIRGYCNNSDAFGHSINYYYNDILHKSNMTRVLVWTIIQLMDERVC